MHHNKPRIHRIKHEHCFNKYQISPLDLKEKHEPLAKQCSKRDQESYIRLNGKNAHKS